MNGAILIEYLCQCLVATLRLGDIVTLDNLPAHKRLDVRELIEAAGALYRPSFAAGMYRSARQRSGATWQKPASATKHMTQATRAR
jgi:hypothetical protein